MRAISECDLAAELRAASVAYDLYAERFFIEGDKPPKDRWVFIAQALSRPSLYSQALAKRDSQTICDTAICAAGGGDD